MIDKNIFIHKSDDLREILDEFIPNHESNLDSNIEEQFEELRRNELDRLNINIDNCKIDQSPDNDHLDELRIEDEGLIDSEENVNEPDFANDDGRKTKQIMLIGGNGLIMMWSLTSINLISKAALNHLKDKRLKQNLIFCNYL